jgi:hypothetical protein
MEGIYTGLYLSARVNDEHYKRRYGQSSRGGMSWIHPEYTAWCFPLFAAVDTGVFYNFGKSKTWLSFLISSSSGNWTLLQRYGWFNEFEIPTNQGRRGRVRAPMKNFFRAPSKGGPAKNIFTLNRQDWLSVAEWLGLGLKGLICTIDK